VARRIPPRAARRPTAVQLIDLLLAGGGLASRPELRRAAEAAQRSGRHAESTGLSSRRWRRAAPVLAAAAVVATAAALLTLTPVRELVAGGEPEPLTVITVPGVDPTAASSVPAASPAAPDPEER
jgi:hypothetical protein